MVAPEYRLNNESIHNAVNSYISWVYNFLKFIVLLAALTPILEYLIFPDILSK